MSGDNFKVPPKSWADVRAHTDELRSAFGLEDVALFPVIELLEKIMDNRHELVSLEIWPVGSMNGAEGETCPSGDFIRLREDVYNAAWAGEARARFTVAHEIGHWHMHTNVTLARAQPGERVPGFRASEPQANQYAAELLMPTKFFKPNDTALMVMMRHGVSAQAAEIRLRYLKEEQFI